MSYDNDVTLSSTTETTIVAAGGTGRYRDLLYLAAYNLSTTGTNITVRDNTAGTIRAILACPPTGGGVAELRPVNPMRQVTANKPWSVQLGTAVTNVYVFAQAEDRAKLP